MKLFWLKHLIEIFKVRTWVFIYYNSLFRFQITFEDILPRVPTRSSVAQKFNALLELKKWQAIELEQESVSTEAPALYGTIWIGEGEKMHETLKFPPGAVTPAQ